MGFGAGEPHVVDGHQPFAVGGQAGQVAGAQVTEPSPSGVPRITMPPLPACFDDAAGVLSLWPKT
jgi:hypothetical protein